jgi:integrase
MTDRRERRILFIRPNKDFGSVSQCCRLATVLGPIDFSFRYFDAPLLAFLLNAEGEPVWKPTIYLSYCAVRSRSATGDTIRSYAEALQVWLRFLDQSNVDLERATEDTLGAFRSQLVHRPMRTGKTYASATANHRVSVVCGFYLWGQESGTFHTSLGAFLAARNKNLHNQNGTRSALMALMPRSLAPAVIRRLPRALSYEEIHLLFQQVPQPYRLIFKWALLTGLRRFEICGLTIRQLPSPRQIELSRDGFVQINVLRKGSRDTTSYVPVKLVEETRWYILADRAAPHSDGSSAIFLNQRGRPIARSSVSRTFRKHADRIGTNATFHHLRHTFAINVLKILEMAELKGQATNSLKTLQVLMGHSSFESTEIYLRAMDVSSDSVMQALDYLYGATI